MKVVKSATATSFDFAKCNSKVIVAAGKPCNERDLACGKNTR